MIPPPPTSTLFPYTTLFRSHLLQRGANTIEIALDRDVIGRDLLSFGIEEHEDRKSTRLNSSHVSISYAVFCLKKKMTDVNEAIEEFNEVKEYLHIAPMIKIT